MKKVILASLAIAANLAIATPADAQVLKMGIKGGVNLCETKFSHGDVESKDKKGFFIGPTLKIAIPLLPLGFDIAALYDQREFKVCDSDMPVKLKQLAIPVNVSPLAPARVSPPSSSPDHNTASTSTTRRR